MLAELTIHFANADAPLAIDDHIAHLRHFHPGFRHVILPNDAHGRIAEQGEFETQLARRTPCYTGRIDADPHHHSPGLLEVG